MARVVLTPTAPNRDGVTSVAAAAGDPVNGHVVANSGRTVITVANTDGAAAHTVTFVIPGTVDGQEIADRAESIPAGETRVFGRFDPSIYASQMSIDVDDAQLTLQALEP